MLWLDNTKFKAAPRIAITEGLFASTPIATPDGWLCLDQLRAGDTVLTFDAGNQTVRHVQRHRIAASAQPADWPVRIPAGTLGKHGTLLLPPDQTVLIEADLAEELYDEAFVTLPALALVGWRGCERVAPPDEEVVTITLDTAQLVYAGNDLLVGVAGEPSVSALLQGEPISAIPLGPAAARHLIACLIAEEAGADLRRAIA